MLRWSPRRPGAAAAIIILAAASGASGAVISAGAASASAPAFTWGPAQDVPISSAVGMYPDVTAMSCPAVGDCVAAGDYYNGALPGFVVEETNGSWGTAQPIPGLAPLSGDPEVTVNSVSCASPGNCAVAGSIYAPYPTPASTKLLRGFVVSEAADVWGTADILPPPVAAARLGAGKMTSVSCSAPGDCVAGGYDLTDYQTTVAVVVEETGGTWGAPELIPGAPARDGVTSVSCTAPGDCVAGLGLAHQTGYAAALATEQGGTWSVQAVPGLSGLFSQQYDSAVEAVSCTAAGECTAAGQADVLGGGYLLYVVGEQGGVWGQASVLPNGPQDAVTNLYTGQLPLSCAAPGDCALGAGGGIANEVNGTWTSYVAYPSLLAVSPPVTLLGADAIVTTLSCPSPGNCSAGGYVAANSTSTYAFVIDEVNGTWGNAIQVPGTGNGADVMALSCAAAGNCVAAGVDATGGPGGYFTEQIPVVATTTTVTLSAASVPYGGEQSENVTVTVNAASGIPAGSATVQSGSATVCTVTLSGGSGSCTLGATRFGAGQVFLTARYTGPAWYDPSTSPAVSFQVNRASTRTTLVLSTGTVRYGQENAERIRVAVIPRHAGTPTGTVTVTTGRLTVCVIRLSRGAGSCPMAASKLRPGTYYLVARYGGNADFTGSASSAARLRVT